MDLNKIKKEYPIYTGATSHNTIDLTGKTFGNLLVLYRTLNRNDVSQNRQAQWVCECQCENKTICVKAGIDLRSGKVTSCGCKKGHKTKEIEPGTIINNWQIIERVPNKGQHRVYYKCKCIKCNKTITEVARSNLLNNNSTGCKYCRSQAAKEKVIKNETGKTYGFLKVKRIATEQEKPRKRHGVYWVCDCLNCGNKNVIIFGDYLRNGDTISCGCVNSKNEAKIQKMLNELNIPYQKQKNFFSEKFLPFDFFVDNKYIIEYDGEQHFLKNHAFSSESFEKTQANDLIKNRYCFENHIPIIRIPYDTEYTVEDLKIETTKFLLTKENEQEYYIKNSQKKGQ